MFETSIIKAQNREELLCLANRCEGASREEQPAMILTACDVLYSVPPGVPGARAGEEMKRRVQALLELDATESAVLALMPEGTSYTGGHFPGETIAQVIISKDRKAHSRKAQTMAMGWTSALLRACAQ